METKVCTKCKIKKSVENFYKNKYYKGGYNYMCKYCQYPHLSFKRNQPKIKLYEDEIFKPINGYENLYEISNYGRVYNLFRNGFVKTTKIRKSKNYNFLSVLLYKTTNGIIRGESFNLVKLVAIHFVKNYNTLITTEALLIDDKKHPSYNNVVWTDIITRNKYINGLFDDYKTLFTIKIIRELRDSFDEHPSKLKSVINKYKLEKYFSYKQTNKSCYYDLNNILKYVTFDKVDPEKKYIYKINNNKIKSIRWSTKRKLRKLSVEDIDNIKKDYVKIPIYYRLAKKYEVDPRAIFRVINGR